MCIGVFACFFLGGGGLLGVLRLIRLRAGGPGVRLLDARKEKVGDRKTARERNRGRRKGEFGGGDKDGTIKNPYAQGAPLPPPYGYILGSISESHQTFLDFFGPPSRNTIYKTIASLQKSCGTPCTGVSWLPRDSNGLLGSSGTRMACSVRPALEWPARFVRDSNGLLGSELELQPNDVGSSS